MSAEPPVEITRAQAKAQVLVEALPYIQQYHRRFIVVKFGGAAMDATDVSRSILTDIVLMRQMGMWPVVVHGGGPRIDQELAARGIATERVEGLRVTDRATMDVVHQVLIDEISQELVDWIKDAGGRAIALNGRSNYFLECRKLALPDRPEIDLGFVGEITHVDADLAERLSGGDLIPVVAPIARGEQDEALYNVNADTVAAAIARHLRAAKLVMLSNVAGIETRPGDANSLVRHLDGPQARELIDRGAVAGGMLPKVRACLDALEAGVPKAHVISGYMEHSLLLEIFTQTGVGTEIVWQNRS